MNRNSLFCRVRRALVAVLASQFACLPVMADQLEQHQQIMDQLLQQGVKPLVADCAAHASFVVPTSPAFDRVEFPTEFLDDQHASVESWNAPFDTHKQRVEVDTVVTVKGLAYRKAGESAPDLLTFRCGYVQNAMLAFGYDDPSLRASVAPSSGRSRASAGSRRRHGAVATARGGSRKAASGKARSGKASAKASTKSSTRSSTRGKTAQKSTRKSH